ncbi:uncharacterized protein BX664DRAFT_313877 [Halteromyces radiatus]|uniref:uncharacterized protein n=1 Tax=Halteromyces radiatus TaxID=101107 RepID=UPI00222100F2|nr:uncharacterized protein BX664DRAFT_313877 [Halteromyces radiatus]KAI8093875.1 hypothetical protein BX664DRAFT_313877 [Halteromyces radiatus]
MDLVKMECISAHSVPSIFPQALSSQILVEEHFGYHYRLATAPVLLVISILFDKKSTTYTIREVLLVISLVLVFMIGISISAPDVAKDSGLYNQMSDGHHYFILNIWSSEDHGVLIFVCLRAMDLVEDDQFLESFMNLVTEFCAQVGGGQNATRRKFSYCLLIVLFHTGILWSATPFISLRANCYDDIGFTGGTKHSMMQPSLLDYRLYNKDDANIQ